MLDIKYTGDDRSAAFRKKLLKGIVPALEKVGGGYNSHSGISIEVGVKYCREKGYSFQLTECNIDGPQGWYLQRTS